MGEIKPRAGDGRRSSPAWRIVIVPVGSSEDGDRAQRRALEIVAKRYHANHSSYASEEG
jgi:hypothetical protein